MTRLSLGLLVLAGIVCLVAGQARAAGAPPSPVLTPLEQALTQIASDDDAVREAALAEAGIAFVKLRRRQLIVGDGRDLLGVTPCGFEHLELTFHRAAFRFFMDRHLERQAFGGGELHRTEPAVRVHE